MRDEERWLLIDALLDGSISDADRLRIEAEFIVDPQVRHEYYRRVQLSVLLAQEAADAATDPTAHRMHEGAGISHRRWSLGLKLATGSLIALAASVLVLFVLNRAPSRFSETGTADAAAQPLDAVAKTEISASGFAVLHGHDNAVWNGKRFREGDVLPSGELHLKSGLVHLELFSGVQIVLEGEARFAIDSPMQITMTEGIARAHVPEPAQGFQIKTVSGDVVDLGTEFVVRVDNEGADVHVIDGEVELHPQHGDMLPLHAGVSHRLAMSGLETTAQSTAQETVGPNQFQERMRHKQEQRFSDWSQWQDSAASNANLVAHYRFHTGQPQSRRIENLARGDHAVASDGTIVAARRAVDRWHRMDGAVDFSPIGSRVRVDVPGELSGLTLLCWVKVNSLDRWYNSLFLTDGHEDREPHWQWMDDGRVFFSVKVPQRTGEEKHAQPIYYSPPIWDPAWSGRWVMLAVTYDVENRRVTHYFNGEPVSNEPIHDEALVESIRIGQASICNWSEPMYRTDPDFVLRNLNGTMDEFAIFSTALPAKEIKQWYATGNPNE